MKKKGPTDLPGLAENPPRPCRVWIIEDHVSVRQLLESFVALTVGFVVVGASASDQPAMAAAQRGEVDLIILDLMIPGDGGMNALQRINRLAAPPRVLIYSATATVHSLQLAMTHGAYGYVDKTDSIEELKTAMIRVKAGGVHFSQSPSRLLTSLMKTGTMGPVHLEKLELGVLELLASGQSIKEVAHTLGLSSQRVYRVRQTLMERARAKNAQDLTRYAIEVGLVGVHRPERPANAARPVPEER